MSLDEQLDEQLDRILNDLLNVNSGIIIVPEPHEQFDKAKRATKQLILEARIEEIEKQWEFGLTPEYNAHDRLAELRNQIKGDK